MELSDRIVLLCVGGFIGFVLGYITASVREIKEKVDKVEKHENSRGENGFMRFPVIQDIMLLTVLALTVWAAFSSQEAVNNFKDQQKELEASQRTDKKITECTSDLLTKTITALNERTTYTTQAAAANVELQKAQRAYIAIFDDVPPPSKEEAITAFSDYFTALDQFIIITAKSRDTSEDFPYPTTEEYEKCLNKEE